MILTTPGALVNHTDIGLSVAQAAIPLCLIAFGDGFSEVGYGINAAWLAFTWFWREYLWPIIKVIGYIGIEILEHAN